ncbi:MAG: ABC transporter permease [Bacteroidetes bacterium]|nr:MAG: ABC transporter permease [Bacteroidota bacterium]
MFDIDKWQEILATLTRNPLRTFLTALGVSWGIFMLIIMMGAGNGLEAGALQEFRGTATNSMFLWARRTSEAYAGFQPNRPIRMTNDDYDALQRLLPEARIIAPRNQLGGFRGGNNVTRGKKNGAFEIMGDYPQIRDVEGVLLNTGRFLNPLDIEEHRKVCVIGTRVQELLFEPKENPLGEYIRINDIYFQVVGVFRTKSTGDRAEQETQRIYIPFSTFQRAFNYGNRVSWFALTSQDNLPVSEMEERVMSILKRRHSVAPTDNRAFGHFNLEQQYQRINSVFLGIRFVSWVVGILTLLAGAIGVSNIMLVIVKERTKEIGIRRAIGAKPASIVSQIMLESVILTLFSGYAGLVLGIGLLEGIAWAMDTFKIEAGMFQAPYIQLDLAISALIVLGVAGLFAGLLPASRAVRIRPVDALRAE